MPKCGGASLGEMLRHRFGSQVYLDYKDIPINKSAQRRQSEAQRARKINAIVGRLRFRTTECIHGHFLPFKYLPFLSRKNVVFVTWLRDPIDRLASHYYYWIRAFDVTRSAPLHRKVVEEGWSFERFCFSDEMRNIYGKMLWEFDINRFDFIGLTEFFDEDFLAFAQEYLNLNLIEIPQQNINPNGDINYFEGKQDLRDELRKWHADDYNIYEFALQKREARINAGT